MVVGNRKSNGLWPKEFLMVTSQCVPCPDRTKSRRQMIIEDSEEPVGQSELGLLSGELKYPTD